jgi:hypothetical protein
LPCVGGLLLLRSFGLASSEFRASSVVGVLHTYIQPAVQVVPGVRRVGGRGPGLPGVLGGESLGRI